MDVPGYVESNAREFFDDLADILDAPLVFVAVGLDSDRIAAADLR